MEREPATEGEGGTADAPGGPARRFEKLLENAADVILILDEAGRLTYASPSVRQVLGHTPDVYLGENVLTLIHPQDAARVVAAFRSAQAEPGVHTWIPFRVRRADGAWRDVEAASNVLLDDPVVRGVVVNLRDVTERRRAEEERTALLGLLSHDLRTPLAAVIARAQLLHRRLGGRGTTDPSALQQDAAVIEQTARRMEAMLEELVDLAKPQQGEQIQRGGDRDLGALGGHRRRRDELGGTGRRRPWHRHPGGGAGARRS